MQNGQLAVDIPNQLVFELKEPDSEGKWYFRLNPQVAIAFNKSSDGKIESFTAYLPDGTTLLRPRLQE